MTAGQSRVVSQIIVHPNFDQDTLVNDITLLKLSSPLNMSDPAVSSICLPSVNSTTLAAGEWPAANTGWTENVEKKNVELSKRRKKTRKTSKRKT